MAQWDLQVMKSDLHYTLFFAVKERRERKWSKMYEKLYSWSCHTVFSWLNRAATTLRLAWSKWQCFFLMGKWELKTVQTQK